MFYNFSASIWAGGVLIGEHHVSTSCNDSMYAYLIARVIVGLILGIWALLTLGRDGWDPRFDILEFLCVIALFGLFIWQSVNLSLISSQCQRILGNYIYIYSLKNRTT